MPKLKTHKATAKRLAVTGGKKLKYMKRHAGQDHFNSRDSGEETMGKRRNSSLAKVNMPSAKKLLPYSQ